MNIEDFRLYCLQKSPLVTEEFPFDKKTLVFKIQGKIFALTSVEGDFQFNLKCNPEKAIELRERYSAVIPGYHMSKVHWNTVLADGSIADEELYQFIDHSFKLIFDKLPKKVKILS